jgi:hypothetical protein
MTQIKAKMTSIKKNIASSLILVGFEKMKDSVDEEPAG